MDFIYLDNASTSFPKSPNMASAMADFITTKGININRGSYSPAYDVEETIFSTRQILKELFNGYDEQYVTFTQNVTMSINTVLQGLLNAGDHVLISGMEHNAVLRPLTYLSARGISFDSIPCDTNGIIQLESIESLIKENTKAIVLNHGSNVCGIVQDIAALGAICKTHDIYFIVDCAQTAGTIPIDMKACHIDALCFTGHKGLLGPQGIGGLCLSPRISEVLKPLVYGGTGSVSHLVSMPTNYPDRLEAGTLNLPGIIGLYEGLQYINQKGINTIHRHEITLANRFIDGIKHIPNLILVGHNATFDNPTNNTIFDNQTNHASPELINTSNTVAPKNQRVAVVSITSTGVDNATLAYRLESEHHILTRVGLHCAPLAHQTLGTYPTGTIRFSFGYANTINDVDAAINGLQQLMI